MSPLPANIASDNASDKPALSTADKKQDGALRRMQDEVLTKGPSTLNATSRPEAGATGKDSPGELPSLTIVDSKDHTGRMGNTDPSKIKSESVVSPGSGAGSGSGTRTETGTGTELIDMSNAKSEPLSEGKPNDSDGLFTEVSRSPNFDPKKPTAAFLDQFKDQAVALSPTTSVGHGLISLAGAEKSGFNTIGLEVGTSTLSEQLNAVADKVKSGDLPLGKEDVLNVSLYTIENQPTFKEASDFLGFPVNAENLRGERDHILQQMGDIAKDTGRSNNDKEVASAVLNTNEAIDRIQKNGVEVIHSAGNLGADHFDWEFMNAKTQLSSNKPSGAADEFSGSNSLTTKGDGVLPVRFNREFDMLDPTSASHQVGTLEIGDTGVKFPEHGIGGVLSQNFAFNRESPQRPIDKTVFSFTKESSEEFTSKQGDGSLLGYQYTPMGKIVKFEGQFREIDERKNCALKIHDPSVPDLHANSTRKAPPL